MALTWIARRNIESYGRVVFLEGDEVPVSYVREHDLDDIGLVYGATDDVDAPAPDGSAAQGDPGPQGDPGKDGDPGPQGPPGEGVKVLAAGAPVPADTVPNTVILRLP